MWNFVQLIRDHRARSLVAYSSRRLPLWSTGPLAGSAVPPEYGRSYSWVLVVGWRACVGTEQDKAVLGLRMSARAVFFAVCVGAMNTLGRRNRGGGGG